MNWSMKEVVKVLLVIAILAGGALFVLVTAKRGTILVMASPV